MRVSTLDPEEKTLKNARRVKINIIDLGTLNRPCPRGRERAEGARTWVK